MTERQNDSPMVSHFFSVAQRTTLFSTTTLCRQSNVSHWAPLNSNLTSLPKSSYTAKLKPVWVQMRNRVAPKDVRLVKGKSELHSPKLTVILLLDQLFYRRQNTNSWARKQVQNSILLNLLCAMTPNPVSCTYPIEPYKWKAMHLLYCHIGCCRIMVAWAGVWNRVNFV